MSLSFPSQTELRPDRGLLGGRGGGEQGTAGRRFWFLAGRNQACFLGGLGWGLRGHCWVIEIENSVTQCHSYYKEGGRVANQGFRIVKSCRFFHE